MIPYQARRLIGYFLLIIGFLGIILGGWGIYQIWETKVALESSFSSALETGREALEITATALTNVQDTLDTVGENITSLNNTILTVAQAFNDALPVVDGMATLLKDDLPSTLSATQTSIETAEASAQLLDGVMRALTSIPFYPGDPYNPEVPLHVSLQNVAASLENVPQSLKDIGEQLDANQDNFSNIEDGLINLSISLTGVNKDLVNAKTTVEAYQTLIGSLLSQVDLVESGLPTVLQSVAWYFSVLIFWLLFTQAGLILQGLVFLEKFIPLPPKE